jgi:hypothetical protein
VEVVEADIIPATRTMTYDRARDVLGQHVALSLQSVEDTYCKVPGPGVSIGAEGFEGSGSFGAYVRIAFEDGGVRYFAWTCHHVISRTFLPPAQVLPVLTSWL